VDSDAEAPDAEEAAAKKALAALAKKIGKWWAAEDPPVNSKP
jgi:hypothetical protein